MKHTAGLALYAALWFASGIAAAQASTFGTAARVNGVEISNAAVERNFEEYRRDKQVNVGAIRYPGRVAAMRQDVLNQLIDREVLWQAAQENDMVADDAELDEAIQQVRGQFASEAEFLTRLAMEGFDKDSYRTHIRKTLSARDYMVSLTVDIEISDADVHEFYVSNPDNFELPEGVRARHILLKLARDVDEDARRAAMDKANSLLQQLRGGADFADLARRESQDSSAAQGGDLGYFPRGKMVKPFEDAAFALDVDEVSGIVESPFGLHIIKVEDHQPAQTIPEEVARERIVGRLQEVRAEQAIVDGLAALRAAADIEIVAAL